MHSVSDGYDNYMMDDDLSEWVDKSYIGECAKPVRDNVYPVSRGWISFINALIVFY